LIVYFDTSSLVPIMIEEPSSEVASRLWDEAERVTASRLVYAEARAALAMAHRMDRLDREGLRAAVAVFEGLHNQLEVVEVTEEVVRSAGELAEQFGLRGYDAMHLASASTLVDPELVFAASDQNLLDAARALEIATADLHVDS
jgi:uncharacterized protein